MSKWLPDSSPVPSNPLVNDSTISAFSSQVLPRPATRSSSLNDILERTTAVSGDIRSSTSPALPSKPTTIALSPSSPQQPPRSASLSPSQLRPSQTMASALISPPLRIVPDSPFATNARAPPDLATSSKALLAAVRRLAAQNASIREAWEAERRYLEANRSRAEEVYKEERVIMDETMAGWEVERTELTAEVHKLNQRIGTLEIEKTALQERLGRAESLFRERGRLARIPGLRGGGAPDEGDDEASPTRKTSASIRPPEAASSSSNSQAFINTTTARTRADPRRTTFRNPPNTQLGFSSNPTLLASSGSTRNQSSQPTSTSSIDFLTRLVRPQNKDPRPIPIVDVQEIHPDLEGIPLKATTIQRATFTDSESSRSRDSSRDSSPSPPAVVHPQQPRDQTLQALNAHADQRLTLHAGHTPSHSLSTLGTTTATITSGVPTPTQQLVAESSEQTMVEPTRTNAATTESLTEPPADPEQGSEMDLPIEPDDDPVLKGPLMVRNIPARDEVFFQQLSEKLEVVRRTRESSTGGEATPDTTTDDSVEGADAELEIPLKLKKATNFGMPFGQI